MAATLDQFLLLQIGLSLLAGGVLWCCARAVHALLHWPADSRAFWWISVSLMILPLPMSRLVPNEIAAGIDALMPLDYDSLEGAGLLSLELGSPAHAVPEFGAFVLAAYIAGLAVLVARQLRGHWWLHRLLADTTALFEDALPGPRSRRLARALAKRSTRLRVTDQPISPFALLFPSRQIVLPKALLRRLTDNQCWLLLRHESAHLSQRDARWMTLLFCLCALHWFNPFVWAAARRLRLATELRCDRPAIKRKHMRRAYAEAYLETLRMSASRALPCPAAAFSAHDQGHHKMRIAHILSAKHGQRKSNWQRGTLIGLALAAAATLTAAQAASLGKFDLGKAEAAELPVDDSAAPALRGPIISGRVSSAFGLVRPTISAQAHRGIDLVAARGTAVRSPAAGRVISAEASYGPAPNYGTVVVLDHGNGWQTLYAHLDTYAVNAGDTVQAGDTLGTVGSTGKATGPHVHVEVLRDGQRVDPAGVIEHMVAVQ